MHDVMLLTKERPAAARQAVLRDLFEQDLSPGRVIGSTSTSGAPRRGVDAEGIISADHGALRFGALVRPGWGREGIAYGPFQRENGLALAVFLVNGHNSSRATNLGESLRARLRQWLHGTQPGQRLRRWPLGYLRSHKKENVLRKLRRWRANNQQFRVGVTDNLAVGWFGSEVVRDPATEGNAFIVDAARTQDPCLRAVAGGRGARAVDRLQSNQTYYVVVLREQGAAYYAASLPGATGLVGYPAMRPLAIDPFRDDPTVYAGVHQSVLGEIGFVIDTRVYGVHAGRVEELATWYGTAHVADALTGEGDIAGSRAETGGRWHACGGWLTRTPGGAVAGDGGAAGGALLEAAAPSGLVHALFDAPSPEASVRLVWRGRDDRNHWVFGLHRASLELALVEHGEARTVACLPAAGVNRDGPNAIQVADDGRTFGLYLNGALAFDRWFTDDRLADEVGVGFTVGPGQWNVRRFEAHPRAVPIPPQLDLGAPWSAEGTEVVVADDFAAQPSGDLHGRTAPVGDRAWRREIGTGTFETAAGGGARVVATVERPNPERTAYSVAWDHPRLADVQVEITPPGTARHQGHRGRGGLLFWQDPDHYVTFSIYLDDCIDTASLAAFFYLKGFEDVYDAVWTNLGARVRWGERFTLRLVFDGKNFRGSIDGEPVLYRSLTDVYPAVGRLSINRVGIVANWEWGDDTGTRFHNFVAKA